jgi:hypothetical protein
MTKLLATAATLLALATPALAAPKANGSEAATALAILSFHHEKCDTPQSATVRMGFAFIAGQKAYSQDQLKTAVYKVVKQVSDVGGIDTWCEAVGDKLVDAFETGFNKGMAK